MKKYKISIYYTTVILLFAVTSFALFQYRVLNIKEVAVIDEHKNYYLKTYADSVDEILEICDVELYENDKVVQAMDIEISDGLIIEIERSFNLVINDSDSSITVSTTKHTVKEILQENNIKINDSDIVSPFIDANISEGTNISITRVWSETIKESVITPYITEINLVDDLKDTEVVNISEGSNGLKELEVRVVYENGKIVSKNIVKETVILEPINEIKNKGRESMFVTSRGMPFRYSKILICSATAYDLSYASCGKYPDHPAYGITYTGTQARPGVIAVDPKVIPLKSKVYVESLDYTKDYGFAIAEDTGSAIKGNKIDLFIGDNSSAMRYGRRTVRVYIIEDEVEEEQIKGYGY